MELGVVSRNGKPLINNTNDNNYFSLKFSESGIGPSDHIFLFTNIPSIHLLVNMMIITNLLIKEIN